MHVMKKIVSILLLLFCLYGVASAANYVEICRDKTFLAYLDLSSIKKTHDTQMVYHPGSQVDYYGNIIIDDYSMRMIDSDPYLFGTVKWIPRNAKASEYAYAISSYAITPRELHAQKPVKYVQKLSEKLYDKNNNVIDSYSYKFSNQRYFLAETEYDFAIYNSIFNHYYR